MQRREPGEKHAVRRHRLQHPGRDEDDKVQQAERRHRDAGRDDGACRRAEQHAHHVRSRRRAGGEPRGPQDGQIGDVGEQIYHDDDRDAQHQRPRQVALRLDNLFGDEVGLLPAAVGEEDGDEGGAQRDEGGEPTVGQSRAGSGSDGRGRDEDRGGDQRGKRRELQDREDVLRDRRRLHADVIDPGQQHDRGHRERHRQRRGQAGQCQRVVGEGD